LVGCPDVEPRSIIPLARGPLAITLAEGHSGWGNKWYLFLTKFLTSCLQKLSPFSSVTYFFEDVITTRVLLGKHEGKRLLGRPKRKWEDNIKMNLQEMGCGGMEWIDVAQNRDRWRGFVNAAMNMRVL
jgi:hypothetical protein